MDILGATVESMLLQPNADHDRIFLPTASLSTACHMALRKLTSAIFASRISYYFFVSLSQVPSLNPIYVYARSTVPRYSTFDISALSGN